MLLDGGVFSTPDAPLEENIVHNTGAVIHESSNTPPHQSQQQNSPQSPQPNPHADDVDQLLLQATLMGRVATAFQVYRATLYVEQQAHVLYVISREVILSVDQVCPLTISHPHIYPFQ